MNRGHNGSTNGKAWTHSFLLDLSLRVILPLPLFVSLSDVHLCISASAHALPCLCHDGLKSPFYPHLSLEVFFRTSVSTSNLQAGIIQLF